MRIALAILIFTFAHYCNAQDLYKVKFESKLNEIRQLSVYGYDNGVVVYDEETNYGSDFPRWDSTFDYLEDDIVTFKGDFLYRAIMDSKGKNPSTSPNEWRLYRGRHPYLFLRDSAKTEDLKSLLTSDYAYIRTYAVGALAYRKNDNLFQIVLDNLYDTTRITQYSSDYGWDVCPADLMLWYTVHQFTREQKDILKKLILEKYTHLYTLEEILFFHKTSLDVYPFVKAIVDKGIGGKFGLIALAQYCKSKDIEIIRKGFNLNFNDVYYGGGHTAFFKAIESCPDKSFKADLIQYKLTTDYGSLEDCEYYVRALASYKDADCLVVLNQLAKYDGDYKKRNGVIIYRALEKHYTPMYDALMKEIKEGLNEEDFESEHNRLEESPWNY